MLQEQNTDNKGEVENASSFCVQKNPLVIVMEKIFGFELPPMTKPEWVCGDCYDELCQEGHKMWEFPVFNFIDRQCARCNERVGLHYLCDGVPE